jgi:hypothetical protein
MTVVDMTFFVFAVYVGVGHIREVRVLEEADKTQTSRRGSYLTESDINRSKGRPFTIVKLIIQDTVPYYVMCVPFAASLFRGQGDSRVFRLLILNLINSTVWQGLRHHLVCTCLFESSILLILVVHNTKGAVSHIPQEFSIAVVSTLGCRMVLHLRRQGEESKFAQGGSQLRLSAVDEMLSDVEWAFELRRESFIGTEHSESSSSQYSGTTV